MKNVFQRTDSVRGSISKDRLIAAGPLTKQPGSRPYRIVLLQMQSYHEFIVCHEFFPNDFSIDVYDGLSEVETFREHGHYFNSHEFVQAVQKFAEVVNKHATNYYQSLYREEAA